MNKKYLELTKLIRSKQNDHEILKCLSNYHENDIADMLTVMTPKERKRIYTLLGPQKIAEIFAYLDEPQIYFSELSVKDASKVVSLMDSDDAVDVLGSLDVTRVELKPCAKASVSPACRCGAMCCS